jgi:branched-chain amino acid transport system substrate-binding protein
MEEACMLRSALAALSLAALAAAGPARAGDTIKIGVLVPLTGPYAALGDDQQKASELVVETANKAGGVLGKKVELVVRDDQLDSGVALRKVKEMVFEEKVDFIAGTLSGAVSKVINEFSAKNKIIFMGYPQSDMVYGTDINRYGFSGMVSPDMAATAVADYAFKKLGKRWFALTADYRWGHRLLQGWLHASKQGGGEFLGNIFTPLGTSDFSAFLPRIIAAKPDFIVFNNLGRDQNAALKQASELGILGKTKVVCTKTEILTMKEISPLFDDTVYGGMDFYWELEEKYPQAKNLVRPFVAKYGRPPVQDGQSAFHQISALLDAVKRAGTTETEAVVKALEDGKYSFTKGEERYQKCTHQRGDSYLIVRGLGKKAKDWRLAEVIEEVPSDRIMRNCEWAIKDLPNAEIPLPR